MDVLVIGGGITGLTAAYHLTAAGRRVALIERDRLMQIDTGHTTAHLTMVTDRWFTELVQSFGVERARAVWDAGLVAMAAISDIVHAEAIDCGFDWVPGYLHGAIGAEPGADLDAFKAEANACSEAGFDANLVYDVPLVGGPGVRFGDQARFHPRTYLAAIARSIANRGGQLFEHTSADGFSSDPLSVTANGFAIRCGEIVIATHNPLRGNTGSVDAAAFQTKLALYTSYAVAARVEKGRVPDALLWDTADPYHYLRLEPQRDHDVVIFGGEDHKTGQARDTNECHERLERALTSIVGDVELTHRWSGQVIESADGLPYIGETAAHQYAATAYSGNGMTFGTLAGIIMAARIVGRRTPWSDLFAIDRLPLTDVWTYMRENADYPFYLIRDRVARMADSKKTGPVCTHMGCLTEWNDAEKTWDCPCHGSRFTAGGEVLSGPAETPLQGSQRS